jgi:hypothetical protein
MVRSAAQQRVSNHGRQVHAIAAFVNAQKKPRISPGHDKVREDDGEV